MKWDKFIKPEPMAQSEKLQTTTIRLSPKQLEYLRANNLNLSAIVRDILDKAMKQKGSA